VRLVLAAAVVLVLVVVRRDEGFVADTDAACDAPAATFGETRTLGDHQEIDTHFTCAGATLAGTLYLPTGEGPFPAAVWVHGSGKAERLGFGGDVVPGLIHAGVAVLSYDKRGVGESGGTCCPGDGGDFDLLAADAAGAVDALRARPEIDPDRIGLIGASQAGWVVPMAAVRSGHVAFVALADGPAVSYGEEHLYSKLTGEEGGHPSGLSAEEIAARLATAGPSGFDPAPYLTQLTVPGLWLYGGADLSVPVDQSVAVLTRLREVKGKDFTVVVFPNAGHGLLDVPPSAPQAPPTFIAWILAHTGLAVATPTS
jgi:dipeptidyl aminopeptidase/acylaminoacyl peptidase